MGRRGPAWLTVLKAVFSAAGLVSGLILKGIGHLLESLGVSWADGVVTVAHVLLLVVAVVIVGRLLLGAAMKSRPRIRAQRAVGALQRSGSAGAEPAVQALVGAGLFPGAAMAIVEAGKSRTVCLGRARSDSDDPPRDDSIFEIGSLSKVFTGILLAEMVGRGEVALEDPLARHLPDLPAEQGPITLLDLATHHSGLPRLPGKLMRTVLLEALRGEDATADPYAGYTDDDLLAALRTARLRSGRFAYSNFGFAVLGLALARAAGMPYERLVEERVCRPLGLTDTVVDLGPDRSGRRAQGHKREGRPAPDWHTGAIAPAGGLHSTATDMLRFVELLLAPERSPLASALELAMEPRRPAERGERIGLGWLTNSKGATWHNGGTGGFSAFLGVSRERSRGVAALANGAHDALLDQVCLRAL